MDTVDGGRRGAPYRRLADQVRPRRMAHILLFTTNVARAIEFYGRTLGLRLSDRSGDGIAFLHGIHGSDHHMIAFAKSSAPGFHPVSWDLPNVNLVGLGAMQMADKGFTQAGAWVGMCSAPITSITCAIRGAATANTPPILTTSGQLRLGSGRSSCGRLAVSMGSSGSQGLRDELRG